MLEAEQHGSNCFVTLTYNDKHLPVLANGMSTLAPEDVQRFMKRIRKAVSQTILSSGKRIKTGVKLRYYLVGEYGDKTERPHYHAAIFGLAGCTAGSTLRSRGRPMAERCCASCRLVFSTWGLGDCDVGRLEENSAKYLVGYVLKKMTRFDDPRLDGRMPEFARMSLRPGIGFSALHEIADVLMRLDLDESEADVPSALRRGKTMWPLGRYLRGKLRLLIGREVNCPDEVVQEAALKLLPMRLAAREGKDGIVSFKAHVVEAFKQEVLNREAKHRIFNSRRSI